MFKHFIKQIVVILIILKRQIIIPWEKAIKKQQKGKLQWVRSVKAVRTGSKKQNLLSQQKKKHSHSPKRVAFLLVTVFLH